MVALLDPDTFRLFSSRPERLIELVEGLGPTKQIVVDEIQKALRLLETMSFSHGALVNTSAVARDCQVSRTTADGYVEVLEDLLLGFRVPAFTRRAKRHLASHPKFYYFDAGVHPERPLSAQ